MYEVYEVYSDMHFWIHLFKCVKERFHVKAVFVTNRFINVTGYIWSGGWLSILFLMLVFFLFGIVFFLFFCFDIYPLLVKNLSVLIFNGDIFCHLDKISSFLTKEINDRLSVWSIWSVFWYFTVQRFKILRLYTPKIFLFLKSRLLLTLSLVFFVRIQTLCNLITLKLKKLWIWNFKSLFMWKQWLICCNVICMKIMIEL